MSREDRRCSCVIVFWVMVFCSTAAVAQSALEWHARGVSFYKQQRFEEASRAFRKANELRPSWKLWYNIGQSEAAAKRYGLALEAFEHYVVQGGDEVPRKRREYVSEEIRRLQPLVGILEVDGPFGGDIFVDGFLRGRIPLTGPLRVAAGSRRIVVQYDGENVVSKIVNIAGGLTTKVDVPGSASQRPALPKAEKNPKNEPEEISSPDDIGETSNDGDDAKGDDAKRTWAWIAAGTGASALAAGAITGSLALAEKRDLERQCAKNSCYPAARKTKSRTDNLALATDILLPAGALLTGAAVLLWIASSDESEDVPSRASASIVPLATPTSAGLGLSGRF